MGFGILRPASHYRALHGNAHPRRRKVRPPHRHQLDGPDRVRCAQRCIHGYRLLCTPPRGIPHQPRNRGVGLPGPLADSLPPLYCRSHLGCGSGGNYVHPLLTADRVLLRSGGGPLRYLLLKEAQRRQVPVARPCRRGNRGTGRRCPGMEPQQLHSAAGRIRVGWFRFGIRTDRSTLPLLA